ncbi:hypothetical protein RC96_19150 [Pectobacterium carotovorum subsp. carotovorum]|nr:hypothetical protein RC96_19150 [Pectobacterium carotovorum subsp. carotovorum]
MQKEINVTRIIFDEIVCEKTKKKSGEIGRAVPTRQNRTVFLVDNISDSDGYLRRSIYQKLSINLFTERKR